MWPGRLTMLAVWGGVSIGIGVFTFQYGQGLSYFSSDPRACMNCHIMRPQFDSWQKASHHTVAKCVDCHLPRSGLSKWLAKADNGYRHSKGFTFEDFPEPIAITESNSELLQENCMRCHGELVHEITSTTAYDGSVRCVHCHIDVGHGERVGLGGPSAEFLESP